MDFFSVTTVSFRLLYWFFVIGHANRSITDEYIKIFGEVTYRKDVADQIGIGLDIPSSAIVRILLRNEVEVGTAIVP